MIRGARLSNAEAGTASLLLSTIVSKRLRIQTVDGEAKFKLGNMGQFDRSAACLRLFGDDIDPGEITALLACEPSVAECRGEIIRYASGRERTAKCGQWRLEAADNKPEDLVSQIRWLLGQVTNNLEVWQRLGKMCEINIFCGLFMASGNDGLLLPPDIMFMLGERGILLDLDVYRWIEADDE